MRGFPAGIKPLSIFALYNNTMLKRFLPLLLLFVSGLLAGQDPYYVPINKSKGLPSNAVYDIFQDSKGFIWIAHNEGLSRYDGYEFKTYGSKAQSSTAGSAIGEDRLGRIWYQNFDGYLYYVEHDSLKALEQNKPVGYQHSGIFNKELFVIQPEGIDVYDLETLKIKETIACNGLSISETRQTEHELYVSGEQFFRVGEDHVLHELKPAVELHGDIPGMMCNAGDRMIVVSKQNYNKTCYQFKNDNVVPAFALGPIGFIQNVLYQGGYYWFCSTSGVSAFDKTGAAQNNNIPFFSNKSISSVLKDREGNFWFGTTNEGLLFVPDLKAKIALPDLKPYRFSRSGDNLYIGTRRDEIYKMQLPQLTTSLLYKTNSNHEIVFLDYDSIEQKIISCSSTLKLISESGKLLGEQVFPLKDMKRISNNYFAVAASGLIGLYAPGQHKKDPWDTVYKKYYKELRPEFSAVLEGVRGKSVCYNAQNRTVYYATNTGLYALTLNGLREIKHNDSSIYISRLYAYGGNTYALSTHGTVLQINKNNVISSLSSKYNIQNIKNIRLLGHFLFLLSAKDQYFTDLDDPAAPLTRKQIYADEITDLALWNKKLIAATDAGVLIQDFDGREVKPEIPLFRINNFSVNGNRYDPSAPNVFSYDQNNIGINYSILSFNTGFKYPLYYKINDNDWELTAPESRDLKLVSLSSGTYRITFRLGNLPAEQQSVEFIIKKAWWNSTWFLVVCFLLFALVCYVYYKWQIGLLIRRNRLLSEKIELEQNLNSSILTSIKSQMNPHFFYNALNTIQSFIFTDDKRNATNYLSKFSRLTRMILEMSDKEKVTLGEEIQALTLYLDIEKVRFNDDFNFTITVAENVDVELIKIPSMIIQPYVENAIKHGLLHKKEKKNLSITFKREEKNLLITIDDDGIGRRRSEELNRIRQDKHSSFSTRANQKRLELLNKGTGNKLGVLFTDKLDEKNNAAGTTVLITIPIQ